MAMTDEEKLEMLKTLLFIDLADTSEDARFAAYLKVAERELLAWRYSYGTGETRETVTVVPDEYEMTQIYAVIAGFTQAGAENQTYHHENGINRHFQYTDMVQYIRSNVVPLCKVLV